MNYDYASIEAKWQKYWEEHDTFHTDVWDFSKPKYYVLDMFPYPSGVVLQRAKQPNDRSEQPAAPQKSKP